MPIEPVVTINLVYYIAASVGIAVVIVLWVSQRFSALWRAFDGFRLHVAETYSTKIGQQDSENRILSEIRRLGDRIDSMLGGHNKDQH